MNKINIQNAIIKRKYFQYLRNCEGLSENTIKGIELAISLFEEFTHQENFIRFTSDKASNFKGWLQVRKYRGKNISLYTYKTYLKYLKKFFLWLSQQPGYISKIKPNLIEYLNLRNRENKIFSLYNRVKYPDPEYCIKLAKSIIPENEIDLRDRALISFTFLTGMRDQAIISLPLECVDEVNLRVRQDPTYGVETKFTKLILSKIFEIDKDLVKFLVDWIQYLKNKGFSPKDPIFPKSKENQNDSIICFQKPVEVESIFWKSTSSIRKIFKERSKQAELPYYQPRTIRHTTAYIATKSARSGRELKAISQHFGHEDIKTTLQIYGKYDEESLLETLDNIDFSNNKSSTMDDIMKELRDLKKQIPGSTQNENLVK